MVSFPQAVSNAVQAAACSVLGDVNAAFDYLSPVTGNAPSNATARALRNMSCGEPGPDDPSPPFTGGQCPTSYRVQATGLIDGIQETTGVTTGDGPVQGLNFREVNNPAKKRLEFVFAGGQTQPGSGIPTIPNEETSTWQLQVLGTVDGSPDDCGNPPIVPNPPAPINITTNITYEGDDNVTYNRDIDINLLVPIINVSGELEIPVRVDLEPNFSIDGRIGFNPDFNIRLSPGGLSPDPTETPPDEPSDCIKGVVFRLQPGPLALATQLFREPGPDLHVPRIASVSFLVGVGGSQYWTPPVDVKVEVGVVPVPGGLCAKGWAVSPEPGVEVIFQSAFGDA